MREDLDREEVRHVVDRTVSELLEAAGIAQPPVDAIALAQRHLGMVVCLDRRQPQRGRAQRAAGLKQIHLQPEPTEERQQWTVPQEIGEHLKPQLLQRLGVAPEQTHALLGESLANLFAQRLLVPTAWLSASAPELEYDLLELKQIYRTASHEVLAWRLLDLPSPCIISVIDNERVHRRRSNAFRVRKELEPVEWQCQRQVKRTGQPCRLRSAGWTVQGWPIHQAEWQREILRSVVDE